ncbi:MAG: arsenate reductase ArsC [Candidatus Sumerlaeaceae bacterium]|nr:arsenate reductase ArsC [Candidatus Sumerlaeaceae bacterium]
MITKYKLLFVCVENSNRSQMAEAFARYHGGELVEAWSAGSRPSGCINPRAIASMSERGIDISQHHSKALTELPCYDWDWMITMGCGDECPVIQAKNREDWQLPDPRELPHEEFNRVRDEIERRVLELLARLRQSQEQL